jgi:transcriptional regulator with XRE-family HTH domain
LEELAERATSSEELLSQFLAGVSSPTARVRFASAKALRMISEKKPYSLYQHWEFFVCLLDSENSILRWNAMDIIANLTPVDSRRRFEGLFNKFYGYLYKGSLITAGHVVDNSGKITKAIPELKDKITKELLKVEKVPLPTEECRNILIGKTISAFDAYSNKIRNNDEVIAFVKMQLNNPRKSTRAKAEKLWKKLEKRKTR